MSKDSLEFLNAITSTSNPFQLVETVGDVQRALTNLPGAPWAKYSKEKHLPGNNFTGANTNLELRLNPDDTPKSDSIPINRVDWAAYRHDLACRNMVLTFVI